VNRGRSLRRSHSMPVSRLDYDSRPSARGAAHAAGILQGRVPAASRGCEVWDGHVFIHFGMAESAPRRSVLDTPERDGARASASGGGAPREITNALRDQLADLPERFAAWGMTDLRLGRRIVYDVKANWKLIILNFNECLHCPNLHPALNKLHHYLDAENVAPTACYCGGAMGFRENVETMSIDGRRRREYLPGLTESQRQQVVYYSIYPNFLLSLHPDYVMTHTLWPRAHNRTEIICECTSIRPSSRNRTFRPTMRLNSGI